MTSGASPARRANAVTLSCVRSPGASFFRQRAAGLLGGEGGGRGALAGLSGGGHFPEQFRSWQSSPPFLIVFYTLQHTFLCLSLRMTFLFLKRLLLFCRKCKVQIGNLQIQNPAGLFFPFSAQCEEISEFDFAATDPNHFTVRRDTFNLN